MVFKLAPPPWTGDVNHHFGRDGTLVDVRQRAGSRGETVDGTEIGLTLPMPSQRTTWERVRSQRCFCRPPVAPRAAIALSEFTVWPNHGWAALCSSPPSHPRRRSWSDSSAKDPCQRPHGHCAAEKSGSLFEAVNLVQTVAKARLRLLLCPNALN